MLKACQVVKVKTGFYKDCEGVCIEEYYDLDPSGKVYKYLIRFKDTTLPEKWIFEKDLDIVK